MGIGAKLTFAFLTVILIMVLGHAGYTLFLDYQTSRDAAAKRVDVGVNKINRDFGLICEANKEFVKQIAGDPQIISAFQRQDREALKNQLKDLIEKSNFPGFITFTNKNGTVFYTSDTPTSFDYSLLATGSGGSLGQSDRGVEFVLSHNDMYSGAAYFNKTGVVALSSMAPVRQGDQIGGVAIVSQPLNDEFLTGLVEKFGLEPDHLNNVELALVSTDDKKLIGATPGLAKSHNAFISDLTMHGQAAIPKGNFEIMGFCWNPFYRPSAGFEDEGYWWKQLPLTSVSQADVIAILLCGTSVPDVRSRLTSIGLLAATVGGVGLLFAFLFSAGISKGINEPLQFLILRTQELAQNRSNLPPLEGLSGEWLELGELIDTAVTSSRQAAQSLKQQVLKQSEEIEEKFKQSQTQTIEVDKLNQQYENQKRQLSEVAKQINYANRQAVLLQHKLDSVLQISTEGFLILDQFGNVLSANPVFLNWMGATEGEIAGRLCFDLVKKPGEPRPTNLQGESFGRHSDNPNDLINQFYPEGIVYHRYQDKQVQVLAHLQPVVSEDGNIAGYIMVLRDKSLRSEVAQLKSDIVSMLSESIRGPVVAAESTWATIMSNAGQTMHPSVGQHLADLHGQYQKLLAVIDSLLMTYGGFVPPPVTLRQQVHMQRLVSDCLAEMGNFARDRQLSLDQKSQTGLPPIHTDAAQLKSIVLQVLEKMIGVTAPGGRVRVETMIKSQEMRMSVASSGPALPQNEIADMFVGFIQGKHHESSYSARLAMYLARNNVERLGGQIWAESEAGRGTTIYFTLPVGH